LVSLSGVRLLSARSGLSNPEFPTEPADDIQPQFSNTQKINEKAAMVERFLTQAAEAKVSDGSGR
jgi:hypothetical protein